MVSEKEFLDVYFQYDNRREAKIENKIKSIYIDKMKLYKSLTSLVNYRCKNGCKSHGVTKKGIGKCCCGYCKENVGYLRQISYKDIPIYAKSFGENGFWTEIGCVLPREFRSCTCLTQCCRYDELTLAESNLLDIIRNGKESFDSYLRIYNIEGSDGVVDHLKKRLMEGTK